MGMEVFILVLGIHINPTMVFFDEFSYCNENYNEILHRCDFQSRDLEDWETQEATMSVCMYVSVSQKIIRFKSMNSSDKI